MKTSVKRTKVSSETLRVSEGIYKFDHLENTNVHLHFDEKRTKPFKGQR